MKTVIGIILLAGAAAAQSLSVTPADGSVKTGYIALTGSPVNLPALARIDFYVDNRLECTTQSKTQGVWSCPFTNSGYADYRAITVYGKAYDAKGALLATSPTDTFRINYTGMNAVGTFSDSVHGTVTRGATVSGNLTINYGQNYSVSSPLGTLNTKFYIDGMDDKTDGALRTPYFSQDSINLATSTIYAPIIPFHTGEAIGFLCRDTGTILCSSLPNLGLPAPLQPNYLVRYYAIVTDGNHFKVADTLAHAQAGTAITLTTKNNGVNVFMDVNKGEAAFIVSYVNYANAVADTTYFRNGRHRVMTWNVANNQALSVSATVAATAVNTATGCVAWTNAPFILGESVTMSGTRPPEWVTPMYTFLTDANTVCFASSLVNAKAGIAIHPLSNQGSGTLTASFATQTGNWEPDSRWPQQFGADVNWFDFENGNAVQELRTNYSRIYLTNGETLQLHAYTENCDQTQTAVADNAVLWGGNDTAIATVSSTGLVTGGAKRGEAWISVIDNVHNRVTHVIVCTVPDHSTNQHLSLGHGILNTYTPGQSIWATAFFYASAPNLSFNLGASNWFRAAGIRGVSGPGYGTWSANYNSYAAWLAFWNSAIGGSKSAQQANLAAYNPDNWFGFYATDQDACNGTTSWNLQQNLWRQQAMNKIFADFASNTIAMEPCDEFTSWFGPLVRPQGQIGAAGGPSQITVTGCPAGPPCIGEMTIDWNTYNYLNGFVEIQGATTAAFNGPFTTTYDSAYNPIVSSGVTVGPLGTQNTQFKHRCLDCPNGTHNASTDPNLLVTSYHQAYGPILPVATGGTLSWSGNFTQIVVSGTQGTITCTACGIQDGQSVVLSGFPNATTTFDMASVNAATGKITFGSDQVLENHQTVTLSGGTRPAEWTGLLYVIRLDARNFQLATSLDNAIAGTAIAPLTGGSGTIAMTWLGLNGAYRADFVDANTVHIRTVGVAPLTYNSGNSPGITLQLGVFPTFSQDFAYSMMHDWLPASIPKSVSIIGGASAGSSPADWITNNLYNTSGITNYVVHNISIAARDRYGISAFDTKMVYDQDEISYLPDGTLRANLFAPGVPHIHESAFMGDSCHKLNVGSRECRYWAGDRVTYGGTTPANVFLQTLRAFQTEVGIKPYQMGPLGTAKTLPGVNLTYQAPSDYIDVYPGNFTALAATQMFAQKNAKYVLAPPCNTPDYGEMLFGAARCIPGGGGNLLIVGSYSEEDEPVHVDFTPYRFGGPIRRWNLCTGGDSITPLSSAATSDDVTLTYGCGFAYIFQPAGTADELTTMKLTLNPASAPGGTHAVLEVLYYPKDQVYQRIDCGTGACPAFQVDLHTLAVYYRRRYTKDDGTIVMSGDWEIWPAQ